jgi:hypothetical protein
MTHSLKGARSHVVGLKLSVSRCWSQGVGFKVLVSSYWFQGAGSQVISYQGISWFFKIFIFFFHMQLAPLYASAAPSGHDAVIRRAETLHRNRMV